MKIAITSDTHYGFDHKTHKKHVKFLSKLAEEEFDVLLHMGDWISTKQHQLPRTLKMFREAIDKPILTTIGNHDLWDADTWNTYKRPWKPDRSKTYRSMVVEQAEWMDKYDIHHLAWNPYEFEDVMFYGFDGWYNSLPPQTNDCNFMPRDVDGCAPINQFLNNEAYKAVDRILELQEEHEKNNKDFKYICSTHMAPYSFDPAWLHMCANESFLDFITEKFDYFLVGHSHNDEDWTKNDCRILNAGADYNDPKYKIIEIV